MLEAGVDAPDFTLPNQEGKEISLSNLRGETVVLYFYPRANTVSYNCSNGSTGRRRHHPSL